MKTRITRCICLCAMLSLLLLAAPSRAQVTVTSSNGYSVYIAVAITSLAVPSSCPNGYNYNLNYSYNISFSGNTSSLPSSGLYTLQGNFTCGTQTGLFFDLPNNGGTGSMTTTVNPYRNTADCATATPASLGCLSGYTIDIQGPGISYQTITVTPSNTGGTSLPITLKTFDARMEGTTVALAWTTSVETGRNIFSVERSANGTDWTALTTVEGHGDVNGAAYAYTDVHPRPGMNYYRLKSSSDDGKSPEYSKVIGAKIFSAATDISLYPNHGRDNSLRISGLADAANWNMELSNAAGQRILSTIMKGADVAIPNVPSGMYFVRLNNSITGEYATLKYIRE